MSTTDSLSFSSSTHTSSSSTLTVNPPSICKNSYYILPKEMEHIAEDELIDIVPNFKTTEPIKFYEHTYGPFRPQIDITVPLWFALTLKKQKRCIIRPPGWMSPDTLQQILQEERTNRLQYTRIPYHFHEIFTRLYESCIDDIDLAYGYKSHKVIQTLIKDIIDERHTKSERGLELVTNVTRTAAIKLNYIGSMELTEIRPMILSACHTAFKFQMNDVEHQPLTKPQIQISAVVAPPAAPPASATTTNPLSSTHVSSSSSTNGTNESQDSRYTSSSSVTSVSSSLH